MKKITFVVAAIILGIFSEAGERQSLAQPIAPAADGTNTRVTPEENRYDIHGGKLSGDGGNLFHSFSRFGLDAGETANFISSPEIQNILGRVTGGDASIINGLIQVSGGNSNLFLVNPAGILFGPNATLNVPGDFTATSATRIGFGEHWFRSIGDNNWAALVGAPARFAFDVSYPGSIVNLGNLAVEPGGNIAFFGGTVLNAGTLSAPGGSITLAAVPGESAIRISQANHLLSLEVVASDSLTTAGSLTPLALPELLTGGGANHASDVRVNPDGSIAISGSGMTLDPHTGDAIAVGTLDVAQRQGGALTGGEVNLLGTRVAAIDATIDASGNHGGGTIRIGGDFRGEGSIPNADRTFVSAHTQINADALETGDGGRVIVWADENTWFSGKISARGGSAATSTPHNGGFVEISGKQTLQFRGEVDLRAPQGQLGTLLLDPTDIRIVATAGEAANDNELNADIPNAGDPQGAIFSGDGTGEYTISAETLSLLPASADIVLEATNDIVVENLGDGLIFAEGPGGSISLTADADGDGVGSFSMEDLNDGILARSRNLSISAASIAVGDITTGTFTPGKNGGDIRLTATNGDITAGNLNSSADGNGGLAGNGGAIQVTATDNITIAEINSTSLDSLGGASTSNGGDIALDAGNILTITTRINASSETGGTGNGGNIELTGNEINLPTTPNSISSNNGATLTLQPNNAARNIQVGSATTVAGSLNLTESEWLAIADGFSEKTIGRTDGSGTLTVDANGISSADPLILQSPNGAIAVQGPITGTDDASITLSGNTTLGANLTTATQWIIISGNTTLTNAATIETAGGLLQLGGTVDGNADLTLNAGTGTIEIVDNLGSTTPLGAIAANSTGTTVFQGTIAAESLTTDAGGTTALNGNVTTTGTVGQVYGDDVTVVGDITLSGDELDFGATMSGSGAIALQPTTATQAIAIGNATDSGIGTLDITATDLAALQGFSSLTIGRSDGSGIVTNNTATLVFPTTIQSGSGNITFNTAIDGAQPLTVTSDSGAIAFTDAIGSTTPLTALTANTNSDITLSSNVTTTGADGVSLTSATISLTDPVTVDTSTGNGAIALNSNAIDGNFPLNLTAGSADIALPTVGNTTPLDSLTATTTGAIALSGNLTTQGSDGVTLNAAGISLLSDVSIDTTTGNGNINFTGSVDGNQTLSLNAGIANITLENPVGETTPVNGLSLSGNQIQTEALSATDNIDINGSEAVTVFQPINSGNTVSIDGSDIETNGIIADSAVEINGSGNVTANDDIDAGNTLTLSGNDIQTEALSATDNIDINGSGAVTVFQPINSGNTVSIDGSDIEINGMSAESDINVSGSGTVTLFETVTTTAEGSMTIANGGQLTINGALNLDGSFAQTGGGEVALFDNITTGDDNISFNSAVTYNADNAELNAGLGTITFADRLTLGTTNLTLTGNELDFGGLISGIGILRLRPGSIGQNLQIAGTADTEGLDFTLAEINFLQPGFQAIEIGRSDGTGAIAINAVSFNNSILFQSGSGLLNLLGLLEVTGGGEVTLAGETLALSEGIETADSDITLDGNVILNADITLSTGTGGGNITFLGTVDGTHDLALNSGTGTVSWSQNIGSTNALNGLTVDGAEALISSQLTVLGDIVFNSAIALTGNSEMTSSNGNITFNGTINSSEGSNLSLSAANGGITFNRAVGSGQPLGQLRVSDANSAIANGAIGVQQVNVSANSIQFNQPITTSGGEVVLSAQNQLTANNITTSGGAIRLSNSTGDVNAGNLNSANSTGTGGDIQLESPTGAAIAGNLTATGIAGGNITVMARDRIETGTIDSSGTEGDGGDVFLDPDNNIEVGYINAEGGDSGTGGDIEIITRRYFRASDTFTDRNGEQASISSAGGLGGGNISLSHAGGDDEIPLIIGDDSTNGTAGVITTGPETLELGESFLGPVTRGNIDVITSEVTPPEPEPEPADISVPELPAEESEDAPEAPAESTVPEELEPEPEEAETPIPDENPGEVVESPTDTESPDTSAAQPDSPAAAEDTSTPIAAPVPDVTPVDIDPLPVSEVETPAEPDIPVDIETPAEVALFPEEPPEVLTRQQVRAIATNMETTGKPEVSRDRYVSPLVRTQAERTLVDPGVMAIEDSFTQAFAAYNNIPVTSEPVSLAQAQAIVQKIETETGVRPALVYVHFSPTELQKSRDNDRLEIILVTGQGEPIIQRIEGLTRAEVEKTLTRFRGQLTASGIRRNNSYLDTAQQLYQWIVAPIEEHLEAQNIENLAFIMDVGLRSLPIAALHDGTGFIVEKYSVGLMPSLSLTDTRYTDIRNLPVLAMGASEFNDLSPLPAVPMEVQTITQTLGNGQYFLNDAFTFENLKQQRKALNYSIVHLATHGEFQAGELENSYIQLWDTKLRLNRMRDLGFHDPAVELLVLSACRTALGDEQAELGFAGLAVQAGVKTAVASLWYVSDEGTLGLMSRFYEHLNEAPIKAEALRQAQLDMIRGNVAIANGVLQTSRGEFPLPPAFGNLTVSDLSHPYYWSAFTAIGSPW